MRLRKVHFVIHNQGFYACVKKQELLDYLLAKYGEALEGYLICQELYKHQPDDSHLQGNLFFKNAVHSTAIIKYLKDKYTPKGQESIGRVEIMPVLHEGRAYNYMVNSSKEGGDAEPLSEHAALDARRIRLTIHRELQEIMRSTYLLCHKKAYDTTVWDADGPDPSPYQPPTVTPADFIQNLKP